MIQPILQVRPDCGLLIQSSLISVFYVVSQCQLCSAAAFLQPASCPYLLLRNPTSTVTSPPNPPNLRLRAEVELDRENPILIDFLLVQLPLSDFYDFAQLPPTTRNPIQSPIAQSLSTRFGT